MGFGELSIVSIQYKSLETEQPTRPPLQPKGYRETGMNLHRVIMWFLVFLLSQFPTPHLCLLQQWREADCEIDYVWQE